MTKKNIRFFRISAWLLCILEIWKQIYLTMIVGHYLWWHFPFQICSVPMYLCFAIGYGSKNISTLLCYLMTFSTVGAWAGLLGCPYLEWPREIFTLHSYFWHIYLIMLGWIAGHIWMQYYMNDNDFKKATHLFFFFCIIAYCINLIVYPFGGINLFYVNPSVGMTLPVYRMFVPIIGNSLTTIVFLLSIIGFSSMTLHIWYRASHWYSNKQDKSKTNGQIKTVRESD